MKKIIGKRNIVEINSEYVLKIGEKFESVRPKRLFIEGFAMKKLEKYGLAVPKVLDYGHLIDGREYLKTELINGKVVTSKNLPISLFNIYKDIGSQFRKIPLEFKSFGWINPETLEGEFSTWKEYLCDFVQKYGLRLCKLNLLEKNDIDIILKQVEILPNLMSAGLIHRDLKPENIIFNPENKKIYILDWENVILGDPIFDIAILKTNHKNENIYRGFIKGFLNRPLNNIEKKSINLYSIIAAIGILNFNLKNNLSLDGLYTINKQIKNLQHYSI